MELFMKNIFRILALVLFLPVLSACGKGKELPSVEAAVSQQTVAFLPSSTGVIDKRALLQSLAVGDLFPAPLVPKYSLNALSLGNDNLLPSIADTRYPFHNCISSA
jgi:predicted small lipoprotein YifL